VLLRMLPPLSPKPVRAEAPSLHSYLAQLAQRPIDDDGLSSAAPLSSNANDASVVPT
jgi:hypothetical protein